MVHFVLTNDRRTSQCPIPVPNPTFAGAPSAQSNVRRSSQCRIHLSLRFYLDPLDSRSKCDGRILLLALAFRNQFSPIDPPKTSAGRSGPKRHACRSEPTARCVAMLNTEKAKGPSLDVRGMACRAGSGWSRVGGGSPRRSLQLWLHRVDAII
jgi:hypothetical protein